MVERMVLVNGGGFTSPNDSPRAGVPDWHARQIANAGTLAESRQYLEKMYYDHSLISDEQQSMTALALSVGWNVGLWPRLCKNALLDLILAI
jgi:hypothetical protein